MFPLRLAAAALPIALAAAAGAQPAGVTVAVASFSFNPHPLHLVAGQPVTLTFVNRSGGGHDFTAREFFAAARILTGAAPGGEIELRPHETKTIRLIPAPGTYRARCTHFLHATMGMTDQIIVN